ncbi:hypothetical protein [Sorangium sp. So ce131]|uniref:hypothetical protein n=1 Tax=Sorangium sp. So ce131 TaxID=3133282 RepID=UPI003F63F943
MRWPADQKASVGSRSSRPWNPPSHSRRDTSVCDGSERTSSGRRRKEKVRSASMRGESVLAARSSASSWGLPVSRSRNNAASSAESDVRAESGRR